MYSLKCKMLKKKKKIELLKCIQNQFIYVWESQYRRFWMQTYIIYFFFWLGELILDQVGPRFVLSYQPLTTFPVNFKLSKCFRWKHYLNVNATCYFENPSFIQRTRRLRAHSTLFGLKNSAFVGFRVESKGGWIPDLTSGLLMWQFCWNSCVKETIDSPGKVPRI